MSATPSSLIENPNALTDYLRARMDDIEQELRAISQQWQAMARAGGQREDHAAALLSRLQVHLCELAHFAAACDTQIQRLHENPFGAEVHQ